MNTSTSLKTPIFTREGRKWIPDPMAAGPFRGLYGGAVAGLVGAAMEEHAEGEGWGIPLSAHVLMMRPAPMEPLTTEITVLQSGRRNSVAEATLRDEQGRLIAKGTGIFVKAGEVPAAQALRPLPKPEDERAYGPASLPKRDNATRPPHRNFIDVMDIREERDAEGRPVTWWSSLERPLMPFTSHLGLILAAADNAAAFWLSTSGSWPAPFGFPNVDLSVHVSRAPVGEWIGLAPNAQLHDNAMGMSEGVLYDDAGILGRSCQINILVPRD